jgi:hypothetical protein
MAPAYIRTRPFMCYRLGNKLVAASGPTGSSALDVELQLFTLHKAPRTPGRQDDDFRF